DNTDIAFNLAWSLLVEGDAAAARFWASGVVQREPKDAAVRLVLTWALRKQGRDADADEEWKALLADAPAYDDSAAPDLGRQLARVQGSERAIVLAGDDTNDAELAASHLERPERLRGGGAGQTRPPRAR